MNMPAPAAGADRLFIRRLLLAFLVSLILSCSGGEGNDTAKADKSATDKKPPATAAAQTAKKAKQEAPRVKPLRVILRPEPVAFLPRNAEPVRLDRDIAEGLAASLGRPYQPVVEKDYPKMIDDLLAGKGDLIAASMTITKARAKRVLFSIPYQHVDELLVVPAGKAAAARWQDLDGKTLCVRRGSSYEETLTEMQEQGVKLHIHLEPEDRDTEEIVDRVVSGECPATVVDSHYWSAIKRYFDGVQALRALAENRSIALAMRPGDTRLKKLVNHYLIRRALTGRRDTDYTDDLPGLKKRQRLRMITRNSAAT
ncbi:MAG: transporter substrate-binding domain-containing protein [Gammaproteobacteria bacterium]